MWILSIYIFFYELVKFFFSNTLGYDRVKYGASFDIHKIFLFFFFHRDLTFRKTSESNIVQLLFFYELVEFCF